MKATGDEMCNESVRLRVQTIVETTLAEWLCHEDDNYNAISINLGDCTDFAETLVTSLKAAGIPSSFAYCDDWFSASGEGVDEEALVARSKVELPPGLTWDDIQFNELVHTWVRVGDMHFDSECPEGTTNPFNLRCIRHALTEVMDFVPGRLNDLVERHQWWREAIEIRLYREQNNKHLRDCDEPEQRSMISPA